MNMTTGDKRSSPLTVLALGLLASLSFNWQIAPKLSIWLDLTWFLPLLGAWLAHREGLAVLLAWWPLFALPAVSLELWGSLWIRHYAPATTLLLTVIVATAVDPRARLERLAACLRRGAKGPLTAGLIMLVMAAIDHAVIKHPPLYINLLAIAPALILLWAVRWSELIDGLRPGLAPWQAHTLGWSAGVLIALSMTVNAFVPLALGEVPWGVRLGSLGARDLVPVLCFAAVLLLRIRVFSVAALLCAGLAADRLLTGLTGARIGPIALDSHWSMLSWSSLLEAMAATFVAAMIGTVLRVQAAGQPVRSRALACLLATLGLPLIGSVLLGAHTVPSFGATFWLMAAVAFMLGVHWRERSLLFAVPLLQLLWLIAASLGAIDRSAGKSLAEIGMVAFPFALCGCFLARSRTLSPVAVRSGSGADRQVAVVDISPLTEAVAGIDRSSTWRSFVITAAPFVLLWQSYGLLETATLASEAEAWFGAPPLLQTWHWVLGALLLLIPPALVLLEGIKRQDSFRMLALLTASAVGGGLWYFFGSGLGMMMFEEFEIHRGNLGERVPFMVVLATGVLLLVTALLAGHGNRIIRVVLRVCLVVLGAAMVGVLAWLQAELDGIDFFRVLASLVLILAIAYWASRFVRLRLAMAADTPRNVLFGALGANGFWARMGAAAGLPSSLWTRSALLAPAFWALVTARFVVYAGAVVARQWIVAGVAVIAAGHALFLAGKRLAAREIWRPQANLTAAPSRHILFLRGFDDDQCDFRRSRWNVLAHWLDLWSFRRNLDETMIDEIAQFGAVVALGRPGDRRTPFGAMRHYSTDEDWQRTLADAAIGARAIVLVASRSPGVQWEYELLTRAGLLDKVLLVFRPDSEHSETNRHAAAWFCPGGASAIDSVTQEALKPIAMHRANQDALLLATDRSRAAAYTVALRMYFDHLAKPPCTPAHSSDMSPFPTSALHSPLEPSTTSRAYLRS